MLQLPSQDVLVCTQGGPSHQFGEGAPLKQINTRASGSTQQLANPNTETVPEMRCNNQPEQNADRSQAEQLSSGRDGQEARAEHQCNLIDDTNQAEQGDSNTSAGSSYTQSARQSPTLPGAVARYVVNPAKYIYVPKITNKI